MEIEQIMAAPRPAPVDLSAVFRDWSAHRQNFGAGMLLSAAQAFCGHPSMMFFALQIFPHFVPTSASQRIAVGPSGRPEEPCVEHFWS